MNKDIIVSKILLWAEVIVAARILLFTIPVLMDKGMTRTFSAAHMADWFVLVITFAAAFHLLAGLAALIGHRLAGFFHCLAALVVAALTGGLGYEVLSSKKPLEFYYFYPVVISLAVVFFLILANRKAAAVAA